MPMSYQREYTECLRVAVIGTGSHTYRNLLPTLNYLPVRLVALCARTNATVEATAKQYGCAAYTSTKAMYENEKPDAVFICVSPEKHPELVAEALSYGVHVWVEKPLGVRAAQIEELISLRGELTVVVGLKKAFAPAVVKAREIAESPKYGKLSSILAVYPMTMPLDGEAQLEQGLAPNWLKNGVHPLAFMSSVGGAAKTVTAIIGESGFGSVSIEFKNGVMGTLHLASTLQPSAESYHLFGESWQMDITGAKIELRRQGEFNYNYTSTYAPEGDAAGTIVWDLFNCVATLDNKAEFVQGFFNEMYHFCDCVLNKKAPEQGSLEQTLEVMKLYEAALISHGKPIEII